jgi:hypothetical protein
VDALNLGWECRGQEELHRPVPQSSVGSCYIQRVCVIGRGLGGLRGINIPRDRVLGLPPRIQKALQEMTRGIQIQIIRDLNPDFLLSMKTALRR